MSAVTYPVRVEASLDAPLSRWLWLLKPILAIPHYVVLAFLWIAFTVMSVVAFVSILVTGNYPRPVFDFNVGVMRWTWRVQYYAFGAFATDWYPPFTLAEVTDYPAHLDISYPEHLSRGLALVKWWLLAIPHYIVIGLFIGGGSWAARSSATWEASHDVPWMFGGLIGLLALIAVVALLFTGRYPQSIYDFVLGMNRWVLRVAGYAGLMTDEYPPFRLDMGGSEPGSTLTVPPPAPTGTPQTPPTGREATGPEATSAPRPPGKGWTAGRVIAAVVGAALTLASLALLAGGGVLLGMDRLARDGGYVTSNTRTFTTAGYAVTSDRISLGDAGPDWAYASSILDKVRIRVTSNNTATPVFVGIGPSAAVDRYLAGVQQTRFSDFASHHGVTQVPGGAPSVTPTKASVFTQSVVGTGRQSLVWSAQGGDWTIAVMNADASRAVTVRADLGATIPALPWIAAGLLIAGVVFLAGGVVLIAVPASRAGR